MNTIPASSIERRLNAVYKSNNTNNRTSSPSVIFPTDTYPHSISYDTLVHLPRYIIDSGVTRGINSSFDQFCYWGWTAAAVEVIEEELNQCLDLPYEIYPENWDENEDVDEDLWVSGVILSRLSPLQTLFRFAMIYGRMQRSVLQAGSDQIPTKAALLGDLPRVIEYMAFAILDGIASTAIRENSRTSWDERLRRFTEKLSPVTQEVMSDINNLNTPNGYLPSYGTEIAEQHRPVVRDEQIQYSSFFEFLAKVRNRVYHDARSSNVGRYALTLICAIVWDQLSSSQYESIREEVLSNLSEDLKAADADYNADAGFEDFCICTGGKRYLEFYPFSSAELDTQEFNNSVE